MSSTKEQKPSYWRQLGHTKKFTRGHTVKVHKADGTTTVQHFKLDGAVMLERDVREYFPDSETVNNALRCLIPLMPKKRGEKVRA